MEAHLVVLLGLLICAPGLVIFAVLWQAVETRRLGQAEQAKERELVSEPRFFARLSPRETAERRVDEKAVARFQEYVTSEQACAAEFVSEPSIESLYRRTRRGAQLN